MTRKFRLHDGKNGSAIAIRVTSRSSKNEISEILDDGTIKIRLTAPPIEGQTNQALVQFLSGIFGVSPSRIEVVAGQTGRDKLVTVLDMDTSIVQDLILKNLA